VPVVVFVTQENERNTGDQYRLAFELLEKHLIVSLRKTLSELHAQMTLVPGDGDQPPSAIIEDRYVASVFYFRSTYRVDDFKDENCWTARRDVEVSSAVKCPSVPYHLVTYKKIQQAIYPTAVLRRFLNPAAAELLAATFVAQYSLNPTEVGPAQVAATIAAALDRPERYVLKPQMEGGGNLIHGEAMVRDLSATEPSDPITFGKVRKEYILMEKIIPRTSAGTVMKGGEAFHHANLVSELGTFGAVLSDGVHLALNEYAGYVVRTKPADIQDGGVMAGVAALDALCVDPSLIGLASN
jgi:glutathione synthase